MQRTVAADLNVCRFVCGKGNENCQTLFLLFKKLNNMKKAFLLSWWADQIEIGVHCFQFLPKNPALIGKLYFQCTAKFSQAKSLRKSSAAALLKGPRQRSKGGTTKICLAFSTALRNGSGGF
jgi:hypothetical protein